MIRLDLEKHFVKHSKFFLLFFLLKEKKIIVYTQKKKGEKCYKTDEAMGGVVCLEFVPYDVANELLFVNAHS